MWARMLSFVGKLTDGVEARLKGVADGVGRNLGIGNQGGHCAFEQGGEGDFSM